MRCSGLFALVLALVVATVACDNSGSDSSSVTLAPPSTTETFMGTVPIGGSDFNNFTVAQLGTVNITLTAAGPPPTITEGLGVGTPGTGTCSVSVSDYTTTSAGATAQLSGPLAAGTYCVKVFDVGNQLADVTYTVTVAHP